MKQALLDTDTLSYYFRNSPDVVEKVDKYLQDHGFINLSVVTYYEVMNGLLYKDAKSQLERFEYFVQLNNVLALSTEVAKTAAKIYAELRRGGITIGHNDVIIAACAIENDFVLVTNNLNHFGKIRGLVMDNWAKIN